MALSRGRFLCVWIDTPDGWKTGCGYLVDRDDEEIHDRADSLRSEEGGVLMCGGCHRVMVGPVATCNGSLLQALGYQQDSQTPDNGKMK